MRKLWFVVVLVGVLLWPSVPASAHPLGNFSVNQYAGLTLRPGRIEVDAVVDIAEIPTLQDQGRSISAVSECARLADEFAVSVDGRRLVWTVSDQAYRLVAGAGGLSTSRLECRLGASRPDGVVQVDNRYRGDRVGWREMTAVGDGVPVSSSLLSVSVSGGLTAYPRDLLASAPSVRSATLRVGEASAGSAASPVGAAGGGSRWLASAQTRIEAVVGGRLTPVVVGLAFLLALLLGAGHAALPGHGKTVMAAYFAGRRGRVRDALAVGGTVTVAHTGGVLVLGLLLSSSTVLAGERVLAGLEVVSGVLVVLVGVGMLLAARRARAGGGGSHAHGPHSHSHSPDSHSHGPHSHSHGPDSHSHSAHLDSHSHGLGHHHHAHGPDRGRSRRWLGLAGIGLAGGLVPSPSALVVLLGAIGLGRAGLGVALVVAYGVGMAATLTAIGLLLVVAQRHLARLIAGSGWTARAGARLSRLGGRLAASAPTATAALVVVVGLGIGVRAVAL